MSAKPVTILQEDRIHWVVACDGGCGRGINEPKRVGHPKDPYDDNTEIVWEVRTAPTPRRCMWCGPF